MQHLFFENRSKDLDKTVKRKAFIVITGDKGMAGAYNHNILKEAQRMVDEAEDYHLYVVGELGRQYFMNQGYEIDKTFLFSANKPSIHRARVITEYIVELFKEEVFDEVYIIYTRMINSMTSTVEIEELLPILPDITKWANDIAAYALESAVRHGKEWNGYKVVEGRSNRKYSDEDAVAKAAKEHGYTDIYKQSLITITEMQKLMAGHPVD